MFHLPLGRVVVVVDVVARTFSNVIAERTERVLPYAVAEVGAAKFGLALEIRECNVFLVLHNGTD